MITKTVEIPTIGIGAGVDVDGQVLVFHDLLGMKSQEYIDAKFVKRYSDQYENTVSALKQYKNEVENKEFPTESQSYKAGEDIEKMLRRSLRKSLLVIPIRLVDIIRKLITHFTVLAENHRVVKL